MAFYDEEDVWKCPKHPSKRRRTGVCPNCLRDRLVTLCPDCAIVRPCACCPTVTTTSSSSSSSSSFSLFSSTVAADTSTGVGTVGRVSNLIDCEPSFRRSRSVAIPFLRSRSRFAWSIDAGDRENIPASNRTKASSFWSVFKTNKSKKAEEEPRENEELKRNNFDDYTRMMMRSRSVSVQAVSDSRAGDVRSSSGRGKGWYLRSPMKVFRQSKMSKVVQERSPLYRG